MNLFKCTCTIESIRVLKGLNVEVISRLSSPDKKEITAAIERKYGVKFSFTSIIISNWDCVIIN